MINLTWKIKILKRIMGVAFLAVVFTALMSCSNDDENIVKQAKTFVLIHGAWQGAWVWQDVKAGLEKAGQKVVVLELPAHGEDPTTPDKVNLNIYRDKVVTAINNINGKVILVGHSMGGMVVTTVAEAIPAKIEKLIYIGAFLPANGQSLGDLAATDAQSLLGPNLIPSADHLTLDIKREELTNIFCQDGSDHIKALVNTKFGVEPAIPFGDKVTLTTENFGKTDKYYIHTLQDHAVGIDLQRRMVKAAGISKTVDLDSGHCPFLTMPDNITISLLNIIK